MFHECGSGTVRSAEEAVTEALSSAPADRDKLFTEFSDSDHPQAVLRFGDNAADVVPGERALGRRVSA
jgi:hypothetical protein